MSELPFACLMRLIWIDAALVFPGWLNRANICTAFAISVPQASSDLRVFQTAFPDRMTYDKSDKVYRCAPGSRPVYPTEARVCVQQAAEAVRKAGGYR